MVMATKYRLLLLPFLTDEIPWPVMSNEDRLVIAPELLLQYCSMLAR